MAMELWWKEHWQEQIDVNIRYLQAYVSYGLHPIDLTYDFQKIIYIIFNDFLYQQSFLRF